MVQGLPASITDEQQRTLQHLSALLHLFHHRNHNQHRHSIWWRHFSVFRRQLNVLVKDVDQLHAVPASHIARTRKKLRDPQLQSRIQDRLAFWQETLVARWQRAFSQTTADKRFAVLGLVLLAMLAEVCWTTGIVAGFEDLGQAEIERVLERFAQEEWEQGTESVERSGGTEDVGELIKRDEDSVVTSTLVQSLNPRIVADGEDSETTKRSESITEQVQPSIASQKTAKRISTTEVPAKRKKKRRKGGNAIDDLFANF